MQKYKMKSPAEITFVKIRNNNLNDVYENDMPIFTNLSTLDLSDNEIPLHKLRNVTNLQKLNLSFNKISEL